MRVTTTNGCFTALRPTEAAPACLRYEDRVAGTHGSMRVDTTPTQDVNGDLTDGTAVSSAIFCPTGAALAACSSG